MRQANLTLAIRAIGQLNPVGWLVVVYIGVTEHEVFYEIR